MEATNMTEKSKEIGKTTRRRSKRKSEDSENQKPTTNHSEKGNPDGNDAAGRILAENETNCENKSEKGNESSFTIPKSKQKKFRRSYERKFKEIEPPVPEPPSDAILKEMDLNKLNSTKKKRAKDKDEKEFEKWASSINNEFDDIDKFELLVSYE